MRTLTLRTMQQPSYLDTLLYSLVMDMGVLPQDAYSLRQSDKLPPVLRRIVETNARLGRSWGCWTDDRGHWLFIANLPLTQGRPVLHLSCYDAGGNLRETSHWCCDDNDQWQRTNALRHSPEAGSVAAASLTKPGTKGGPSETATIGRGRKMLPRIIRIVAVAILGGASLDGTCYLARDYWRAVFGVPDAPWQLAYTMFPTIIGLALAAATLATFPRPRLHKMLVSVTWTVMVFSVLLSLLLLMRAHRG
jgi:hypothetical protein